MRSPSLARVPPWLGLLGGLILGAFLGLFVTAAVAADSAEAPSTEQALRPGPPPLESLVKPLGLSKRQQQTLRPVFLEARRQAQADIDEARADGLDLQSPQARARMQARDTDFRERLATVLTPAQLDTWDRLTADEREARQRPAGTNPVHGHHEMDTPATASGNDR